MNIANLASALVKAQAEIEGAAKDKLNPHFRTKYADLGSVVEAIKPALSKYGLAYVQVSHDKEHAAAIETVIVHTSGETLSCGIVAVPVSKGDAQGYGSAMTYARRYSLSAAFGVAPEDDDGNAAAAAKPAPNTATEVMGDAFRALQPDEQTLATDWANQAEKLAQSSIKDAFEDLEANLASLDPDLYNDWKMAVAYKLTSKTRNALKAYGQTLRKAA